MHGQQHLFDPEEFPTHRLVFERYPDNRWCISARLITEEGPVYLEEETGPFDDAGNVASIILSLLALVKPDLRAAEVWERAERF